MPDFNDPLFGDTGRIDDALNRLERKINEAVSRVEQVENAQARRARAGRPGEAVGRAAQVETGAIDAETAALERQARAARSAERAKGSAFRPTGATTSPVARPADPVAASQSAAAEAQRARAMRQRMELQFQANEIESQAVARSRILSNELRGQVAVYGSSSQALRKHGALTTEFIQAAARGNVTLAEMRYQVGATIGKFAGWTAAAAAVYGAVGAVAAVGKGAIDADNGVNQLRRTLRGGVDRTAAVEGFRDQSRQFNVPIEDVAAGQYELSKRFQDQNQSLAANEALLYAVKVGELSVADASKYLLATVNAFGLGAEDLLPLMDQYNNLQNRMGVRTSDTAAGVAKAAGQWRAAGGDMQQLIAIVGAGTRVTGLPGGEFGTLLQRSAGLINRPKNQEILRSFGLDPKQGISDLYAQAFELAPQLAHDQLIKLAEGLSTPQLAPRLTALLGQPQFYRRALALADPDAARGSSARELDVVLDSFREKVARLTTDLQQMGAAFAEAGGLIVPGAAIQGLDLVLRLATDIFGVFSRLPDGLQTTAVMLTAIIASLRLARRFNLGDTFSAAGTGRFAGTAPNTLGTLLSQSPERRTRQALTKGLNDELQFFQDERERVARQAAVASRQAAFSQRQVVQMVQRGPIDFDSPEQYQQGLVARQEAANTARRRAVELADEELALAGEIDKTTGRINNYNENVIRNRRMSARQFAEQEGIEALPPGVGVPTTQRPVTAAQIGGRDVNLGQRSARLAQRLDDAILAYNGRVTQWNAAVGNSRGAQAVTRSAQAGVRGTARATSAIGVAGREAAGLARGMGAMAAGLAASLLDPLNLIIIAAIAIPLAIDFVNRKVDEANDALEEINRNTVRPLTLKQRQDEVKRLQGEQNRGPSIGERFQSFAQDTSWWQRLPGPALAGTLTGAGPYDRAAQRRQEEARNAQELQEAYLSAQRRAREQGRPVPFQAMREIDQQRNDDLNAFKRGAITETELRDRMKRRLEEYQKSMEAHQGGQQALQREIEGTQRLLAEATGDTSSGGLAQLYAGLKPDDITNRLGQYLTVAASGQDVSANLKRAAYGYTALTERLAGDNSPAALAQLAEARDQLAQGVENVAKNELDSALLFARSGRQRAAAYDQYRARLRRGLLQQPADRSAKIADRISGRGDAIKLELTGIKLDQSELSDDDKTVADLTAGKDLLERQRRLKQLIADAKDDHSKLRKARRDQREFRRKYREYVEVMKRQEFQQEDQLQAARDEYASYGVQEGLPRIRFQIQRLGQRINAAIRVFGRDSQEVLALLNQQAALREQAAQELEATIQSREDLRLSAIADPVARMRAQVGILRQRVARARSAGRPEKEVNALLAQINETNQQIAEQAKQKAEEAAQNARDLRDARFEYLISRTQDPLRRAQLEVQRARSNVAGTTGADRYRALAQLNDARRQYRETRIEQRVDDINFDLEMEKITREEAAKRLEALARTKGIAKEKRRELLLQAKRLRDETDSEQYNLDVGDIRLPTMYEIRRAVQAGKAERSFASVSNEVTVNVTVEKDADAGLVGTVIEDALGTSNGSIARAMRMR